MLKCACLIVSESVCINTYKATFSWNQSSQSNGRVLSSKHFRVLEATATVAVDGFAWLVSPVLRPSKVNPRRKPFSTISKKKCPNTTHINNSFLNRSRVGRNKQVKKQNKNACWKKFKKIGQFKKLTSREHVSDWRLTSSRDQLIQDGGAYLALHLNLLLVEPCFSSIAWNHTSP